MSMCVCVCLIVCSDGDCGCDLFETDSEEEEEDVKDRTQENILPKKKTAFQVQREKSMHSQMQNAIYRYEFIYFAVSTFNTIVGILTHGTKIYFVFWSLVT